MSKLINWLSSGKQALDGEKKEIPPEVVRMQNSRRRAICKHIYVNAEKPGVDELKTTCKGFIFVYESTVLLS